MPRITLDGVTVDFPIYDGSARSFRHSLLTLGAGGIVRRFRRHVTVRALDDVRLHLDDGDRVGLIGYNGAGKSTLLRVLAGIHEPTGGSISIEGKIAAVLSLSSILDPEMTGWENVEHASALLDISCPRRRSLRDDVMEFTELGAFLDLPVKTYSAGMQLRLSFALMTSQEPDILLLDEVFGTGDTHFRTKAAERMATLSNNTSIVVFASHDTREILRRCNKAVWMEHGRIVRFGPVAEVVAAYSGQAAVTAAPTVP